MKPGNLGPSTTLHESYLATVQWNIEANTDDKLKKYITEMRPFCQLKKAQLVIKGRVKDMHGSQTLDKVPHAILIAADGAARVLLHHLTAH